MIPIDIDESEVKKFKYLLTHLKRLTEDGVTPLIEKQALQILEDVLPIYFSIVLKDKFETVTRLTINNRVLGKNKRINEIKYLNAPPPQKVEKYGRCNKPNQSVFYGTGNWLIASLELKPKEGDLITISTWRVKNDCELLYFPIFNNQPYNKQTTNPITLKIQNLYKTKIEAYPKNAKHLIEEFTQFVADSFTKKNNNNNHLDYVFSAYFSDKILNSYKSKSGQIEAILYPSIPSGLSSMNIAINAEVFNNRYYLEKVEDLIMINENFGHSLSKCKSFDYTSGKILWGDKFYQPEQELNRLKKLYGIDLSTE